MNSYRKILTWACVASLAFVLAAGTGCARKRPKEVTIPTSQGTATTPGGATGDQSGLPEVGNVTWVPFTELKTVYFDYDKYNLRPDAAASLKANVDIIKAQGTPLIQVEGHCDERGTQEYNLALGERRALAVRDYLISLGIPGDKIVTISYGEEMPADPGHTEAAWAKNRRCEFNRAAK